MYTKRTASTTKSLRDGNNDDDVFATSSQQTQSQDVIVIRQKLLRLETETTAPATTRARAKPHHDIKWKIIISSIIFLFLCRTSHVLAIRKGRLMSPSSFTALSGDLHVQIQFSGGGGNEEMPVVGVTMTENATGGNTTTTTTPNTTQPQTEGHLTAIKTTPTANAAATATAAASASVSGPSSFPCHRNNSCHNVVENFITSTLVISKFIDDYDLAAQHSREPSGSDSGAAVNEDNDEDDFGTTTTATVTSSAASSSPPLSFWSSSAIDNRSSWSLNNGNREELLHRRRKEIIQNIPLYPDPRHNVTQIAVPCQTFVRGGLYEMQVVTNLKTTTTTALVTPPSKERNDSATSVTKTTTDRLFTAAPPATVVTTTLMPVSDERLRQTLDVRWPSAEMLVSPERFLTYPSGPIEVTLRFPEVNCERAWLSENLPEFWLELIYCGKERSCSEQSPLLIPSSSNNNSKSNILYAEQVRGYPKLKTVKLSCDLFGLAGNYAVQLRPMIAAPNVPITRRFLSVDWSDKFVFNVYARSIFPCDPHTGIGVLYEYPGCILEQGDRVRVYAKLRADVASLKPPTSLHYVAEQRVVKGQYSLYFNCDLFTEKYVEYCFVYVSQAISGAVADVRMDCVPTLPVSDSDTGGWGPWSEWTPCSSSCLGGTRNRYRFCDSPPPRYGAKFCEGPSVETEKCSQAMGDTWDCIYQTIGNDFRKETRTEVNQEIGPGCRCGCIVHLGSSKPKRIIAGATQSCPGRSFWLIQVDGDEHITLSLNLLRLPCSTQYIKIRDGPSLSSTLLVQLNGGINAQMPLTQLESSGAQLLVEFYAGDEMATMLTTTTTTSSSNDNKTHARSSSSASSSPSSTTSTAFNMNLACTGGFLANVEQMFANTTSEGAASAKLLATTRLSMRSRSMLQKPKLHADFTVVHLSALIFAMIVIVISALLGVQYVIRYRKYHLTLARRRDEGSRLHTPNASMSSLQSPPSRALSTTTLLSEVVYMVKMRPKHQLRHSILRESVDAENLARETEFNHEMGHNGSVNQMMKCDEERGSNGSIVTLRNEITSITSTGDGASRSLSLNGDGEDLAKVHRAGRSHRNSVEGGSSSLRSGGGTLTGKDSAKDSESIISSGMSSLCNSPPMDMKRSSKYSERYDAITLKIRNSNLDDSQPESDTQSRGSDIEHLKRLNGHRSGRASLTNGCYSPAASVVSTATIRTTNAKETKEKQNRKKLLARPGSEFSLGTQEELELDYYDYNVTNAGAAPGSYLGMDPAYLVWIPPFDEMTDSREDDDKTPEPPDDVDDEPDETEPLYEEIKQIPRYGHYLSPGSNTESSATTSNTSPLSDKISPLSGKSAISPAGDIHLKQTIHQKVISNKQRQRHGKQQSKSSLSLETERSKCSRDELNFPMHELTAIKTPRNVSADVLLQTHTSLASSCDTMTGSYVEKETSVVKSPSDLQNFLSIDDIQYADESESDHDAASNGYKTLAEEQESAKEKLLSVGKDAREYEFRKVMNTERSGSGVSGVGVVGGALKAKAKTKPRVTDV